MKDRGDNEVDIGTAGERYPVGMGMRDVKERWNCGYEGGRERDMESR